MFGRYVQVVSYMADITYMGGGYIYLRQICDMYFSRKSVLLLVAR